MTKEDLDKVYMISKEINMWQQEIDKIRAEVQAKGQKITGMPFQNTNAISTPVEDTAIQIVEVEKILAEKKEQLLQVKEECITFILGNPDTVVRQILYHRCLGGLSWRKVAREIGEGYTDESVRQIYHRLCADL